MSSAERPNRLPWPPILYVGAVAAAVALHLASPLAFPEWSKPVAALLGVALLAAGVVLDVAAIRALARARTTVMPHRASEALVTEGPYAFSRNPIYLGNTLALAGLALVFDVPWFLILAPLAALAVQKLAIEREEAHLEARFGPAWRAYAARVRRWV
jgi:protein-S-isoprenylcysteine O-methyltransferase Ste14